jgi:hypothetical protein
MYESLNVDEDEMNGRIYGSHRGTDLFHEYLCKLQVFYQMLLGLYSFFYPNFGNLISISIDLSKCRNNAQGRLGKNFSITLSPTF